MTIFIFTKYFFEELLGFTHNVQLARILLSEYIKISQYTEYRHHNKSIVKGGFEMSSEKNGVLTGIFAIALALLLCLRVDWWWWGKDMPPPHKTTSKYFSR